MGNILEEVDKQFPGFLLINKEQQFRVLFNCVALKELDREQAVKACLALTSAETDK